jgi:hypothetical protein
MHHEWFSHVVTAIGSAYRGQTVSDARLKLRH